MCHFFFFSAEFFFFPTVWIEPEGCMHSWQTVAQCLSTWFTMTLMLWNLHHSEATVFNPTCYETKMSDSLCVCYYEFQKLKPVQISIALEFARVARG